MITQITNLATPFYLSNCVLTAVRYYHSNLGPHTLTVRETYTIPTGRAALIVATYIEVRRVSAATTVGLVRADVSSSILGGAFSILLSGVSFVSNTVNIINKHSRDQCLFLFEDDYISIATADLSTGGSCEYIINVFLNEFDI